MRLLFAESRLIHDTPKEVPKAQGERIEKFPDHAQAIEDARDRLSKDERADVEKETKEFTGKLEGLKHEQLVRIITALYPSVEAWRRKQTDDDKNTRETAAWRLAAEGGKLLVARKELFRRYGETKRELLELKLSTLATEGKKIEKDLKAEQDVDKILDAELRADDIVTERRLIREFLDAKR